MYESRTVAAQISIGRARLAQGIAGSLLFLAFLGMHFYGSFGLPAKGDVSWYFSAIFEMDIGLVAENWTSDAPAFRQSVHPLQKLMIAPLVSNLFERVEFVSRRLQAAQIFVGFTLAVYAMLSGWLAMQLCQKRRLPGVLAAVACSCSAASILLGSLPESASVSGLATLGPLLLANARFGRRFGWSEGMLWGLLGIFGLGITISQIVPWVIALGGRLLHQLRAHTPERRPDWLRRSVPRVILVLGVLVAGSIGLGALQSSVYPGTKRLLQESPHVSPWFRWSDIAARPLTHTVQVGAHFVGYNLIAPEPAYSDHLIYEELPYWALSLESSNPREWSAATVILIGTILALVAAAAWSLRRPPPIFWIPLCVLACQFALHLVFGHEYIMYSTNWTGLVVALLVAAGYRAVEPKALLAAGVLALSLAAATSNLALLNRIHAEIGAGLDVELRDTSGRLLEGEAGEGGGRWPEFVRRVRELRAGRREGRQ